MYELRINGMKFHHGFKSIGILNFKKMNQIMKHIKKNF